MRCRMAILSKYIKSRLVVVVVAESGAVVSRKWDARSKHRRGRQLGKQAVVLMTCDMELR